MSTVTIRYTLPDEQSEYDAARLGREALLALWEIDQRCRSVVRYGEPTEQERALAEEIRGMISEELRDA